MFNIKDKVLLGALSGALVATAFNLLDYISITLKVNKWHIWQIASSLYFPKGDLNTVPALALGAITHTTLMAFAGIIICYVLYYTGRDFYLVKGILILLFFWIGLFGGVLSLGVTSLQQPLGISTNIAHIFGHFGASVIISYLIVKLADPKVWSKPVNTVKIQKNIETNYVKTVAEKHKKKKPTE